MTAQQNEYVALRAAKIKRNQARLCELGLENNPFHCGGFNSRTQRAIQQRFGARNKTSSASDNLPPERVDNTLRRSTRARSKPDTYAEEPHLPPSPKSKRFRHNEDSRASDAVAITPPPPLLPFPAELAPHSARAMRLEVPVLMERFLARRMDQTGKAFVMQQAAMHGAVPAFDGKSKVSFNKYSGVQEWQNAMFLWVNVGAPNSDVVNEFLDCGRHITWFGGSRMHADTPVIQRLLRMGQNEQQSNIVLWCREYDAGRRGFLPYMCLGRLHYVSHDPVTHPIRFVWQLVDRDAILKQCSYDAGVRSAFIAMYETRKAHTDRLHDLKEPL